MSAEATDAVPFTADSFRFLRDLAKHNDRNWFAANKSRYESSVRDPALAFVRAVGPRLESISPHLIADPRPSGGSMMRIYRDLRFTKDKRPYRTSIGIHFEYEGEGAEDGHLPGFFLHVAPADSWAYAGMWQPDSARLQRIRAAIVKRPGDWKKVRAAVPDIEGERLKRPPAGFDPAHPLIEDLKRKGFTAGRSIKDSDVTGPAFPARFISICRSLDPLNRFLAAAVGVDY